MAYGMHGVPPERLHQRLEFLEDRAVAHIDRVHERDDLHERETGLARACAATLWRDAGCVALLVNEIGKARTLFTVSGREFLALGLPTGARLIALANLRESSAILRNFEDVVEGTREQWKRSQARQRRGPLRPMIDSGRESPRQVLSMMQVDWLTTEIEPRDPRRSDPMRAALGRNAGHPAGTTGLSIDSYSKVADWLTVEQRSGSGMPEQIRSKIETLAATRAEHLRAAQADSFHWRQLARPAELIDLDSAVLMFLALGSGVSSHDLKSMMERDVPMTDTPVDVAESLRRDQHLETS